MRLPILPGYAVSINSEHYLKERRDAQIVVSLLVYGVRFLEEKSTATKQSMIYRSVSDA